MNDVWYERGRYRDFFALHGDLIKMSGYTKVSEWLGRWKMSE
jgi:hypothetical protein